jgi:hypothetical protein
VDDGIVTRVSWVAALVVAVEMGTVETVVVVVTLVADVVVLTLVAVILPRLKY